MKIVLCSKRRSVASLLLRWYMGSRWSHSAMWDEELGCVTHATLIGGVHVTPEAEFFDEHPQPRRVIDPGIADTHAARAWLASQVGKGYDWTCLVAIFFRLRSWQHDTRWFCSELTETTRSMFGRRVFNERAARITPYHQDIIADHDL